MSIKTVALIDIAAMYWFIPGNSKTAIIKDVLQSNKDVSEEIF